jgi:hypothetical protein
MFSMKGAFLTIEKEGKVLDVSGNIDAENRNIIVHAKHGGLNQQWDIVYVDEWKEPTKGEMNEDFGLKVDTDFYIVSQLKSNRYIDVLGRNLAIKTRNGRKTQVFYFHQPSKTIRSRNNNQSFDIQSSGKNKNMQIWSTNSGWW